MSPSMAASPPKRYGTGDCHGECGDAVPLIIPCAGAAVGTPTRWLMVTNSAPGLMVCLGACCGAEEFATLLSLFFSCVSAEGVVWRGEKEMGCIYRIIGEEALPGEILTKHGSVVCLL